MKYSLRSLMIVVVALLVAAWIANFFGQFGFGTRWGKFDQQFKFGSGSFCISQLDGNFMKQGIFWMPYSRLPPEIAHAGDLSPLSARLRVSCLDRDDCTIQVPIILLMTAMIPLVYGSFSKFRFRLWHFFAFMAVVAIEFAFFLGK